MPRKRLRDLYQAAATKPGYIYYGGLIVLRLHTGCRRLYSLIVRAFENHSLSEAKRLVEASLEVVRIYIHALKTFFFLEESCLQLHS